MFCAIGGFVLMQNKVMKGVVLMELSNGDWEAQEMGSDGK